MSIFSEDILFYEKVFNGSGECGNEGATSGGITRISFNGDFFVYGELLFATGKNLESLELVFSKIFVVFDTNRPFLFGGLD